MKEKSESHINLSNQINDSCRYKLNKLTLVQKAFPNDDLNLFEIVRPNNYQMPLTTSASSLQKLEKNIVSTNNHKLITTPINTIKKEFSKNNSQYLTIISNKKSSDILTKESFDFRNKSLFGSNLELTSSENKDLNISHDINYLNIRTPKIFRTPTISKSPNNQEEISHFNFTEGLKIDSKSSFVRKHFSIQRRKTIHDIVNLEKINNLINGSKSLNNKSISRIDSILLADSSNKDGKYFTPISILREESLKNNIKYIESNLSLAVPRELVKEGSVLLLNQYTKQERYFFLFNDLLIISKQKNENYNKLKYRILLSEVWLSNCFETISCQCKKDSSILIGWPPAINYIVDFKAEIEKNIWLKKLKELISNEKKKEQDLSVNIKICYNSDNSGSSEPTQYSQCYTKTIQVKSHETAQELVYRCKNLFNLESSDVNDNFITSSLSSFYQLWLKTGKNEPLIPLIGHEFPFAIKMNFLRQTGRSIEEDDNTYTFILIDSNSKMKNINLYSNQIFSNLNKKTNNNTQNLKVNKRNSTINPLNDKVFKENEHLNTYRINKLRKKIFWNKHLTTNYNNPAEINVSHRPKNLNFENKTKELNKNNIMLLEKEPNDKLKNKQCYVSNRSSSLQYVESLLKSDKVTNKKSINSSNNSTSVTSSIANSTLKPFYSKLKKNHLFGVKLEKICGQYSNTNNKLPIQIMSLMEKVAEEGVNSLMIFRKSASAKLKKNFKDKIDSNQHIDYNEINVHIAALLLKEYLRDYPDGIIDFNLFNDCLNVLKISEFELKIEATKLILYELPKWNYVCLKYYMCLFHYISQNSQVNKMDPHNLAVCVAPSIFHKIDRPNDVELSFKTIAFIEFLINNIKVLFGEDTFFLIKTKNNNNLNINIVEKLNPNLESVKNSAVHLTKSTESLNKKNLSNSNKIEIRRMFNMVTFKGKKPLLHKQKDKFSSIISNPVSSTASFSSFRSHSLEKSIFSKKAEISDISHNAKSIETNELDGNNGIIRQSLNEFVKTNKNDELVITGSLLSTYSLPYFNVTDCSKKLNKTNLKNKITEKRRRTSTNNSHEAYNKFIKQSNNCNNSKEQTINFTFEANQNENDLSSYNIDYNDDAYYDESNDENYIDIDEDFDADNNDDEEDYYDDQDIYDLNEIKSKIFINKQSKLKIKQTNNRSIIKIKSNLKTNMKNQKTFNFNKTNHKVSTFSINLEKNKLRNRQHDLSSNTLSVDSGLSVPTTTNSDLESEKSTNLASNNFKNNKLNEKLNVKDTQIESELFNNYKNQLKPEMQEEITARNFENSSINIKLSNQSIENESTHILKLHKQMLSLNDIQSNNHIVNSDSKQYRLKEKEFLNDQNNISKNEINTFYDLTLNSKEKQQENSVIIRSTKINSIKLYESLSYIENNKNKIVCDNDIKSKNMKTEEYLNYLSLPLSIKIRNKDKKLSPSITDIYLKETSERKNVELSDKTGQNDDNKAKSTNNIINENKHNRFIIKSQSPKYQNESKQTSIDSQVLNKEILVSEKNKIKLNETLNKFNKPIKCYQNKPHASRRSIVKINFNNSFNLNEVIKSGLGECNKLDFGTNFINNNMKQTSNNNRHSSTVYVSYSSSSKNCFEDKFSIKKSVESSFLSNEYDSPEKLLVSNLQDISNKNSNVISLINDKSSNYPVQQKYSCIDNKFLNDRNNQNYCSEENKTKNRKIHSQDLNSDSIKYSNSKALVSNLFITFIPLNKDTVRTSLKNDDDDDVMMKYYEKSVVDNHETNQKCIFQLNSCNELDSKINQYDYKNSEDKNFVLEIDNNRRTFEFLSSEGNKTDEIQSALNLKKFDFSDTTDLSSVKVTVSSTNSINSIKKQESINDKMKKRYCQNDPNYVNLEQKNSKTINTIDADKNANSKSKKLSVEEEQSNILINNFDLVSVTWSVHNIRKNFEQSIKPNDNSRSSLSYQTIGRKSINSGLNNENPTTYI